jgi:hypothetical protein
LTLAAALPFLPVLGNGFVWDDVLHIADNPRIRAWSEALGYFTRVEGLYHRPLIFLSYAAEHALWGMWPAGFHLTNVLLHVLVTVLVRAVGIRLGLSPRAAWIAAALFAVHPIQVDAVAYVSGRTDLLVAAGALTVWLVLWSDGRRLGRAVAGLAGTTVAVWSKESGFALVFFLLWALLRRRRAPAVAAPALALAVLLLGLRPGLATLATDQAAHLASPASVGRALATYAGLVVWPAHLQVDRLTLVPDSAAARLFATLFLLACVALLGWAVTRRGPVADCAVWTAAFYFPVANWIVIYPVVADWALFTPEHNFYVPLAGVALLGGLGLDALARSVGARRQQALTAVVAAVLLVNAAASALRTRDWKDEERIFSSAAAAGSESPRVHFNLGNILLARGDTGGAAAEYETALRRAPNDASSWGNLAVARQRRSEYAAALDAYRRALALRPGDARLHENLGSLQVTVGDLRAARASFEWALRLDPDRPLSRRALAALHRDEQRRR